MFAGNLRKFAGVLRVFFCTAQLWTAVACVDKLSGCFKSFTPANLLLSCQTPRALQYCVFQEFYEYQVFAAKSATISRISSQRRKLRLFFRRTKIQVDNSQFEILFSFIKYYPIVSFLFLDYTVHAFALPRSGWQQFG